MQATRPNRRVPILVLGGLLALVGVAGLVVVLTRHRGVDERTRQELLDATSGVASGRLDAFEGWLKTRDVIRAAQHRTGDYSDAFREAAEKEAKEMLDHAVKYRERRLREGAP